MTQIFFSYLGNNVQYYERGISIIKSQKGKYVLFTVSYIYAILQQNYVQFRLDLEIDVCLLSFHTLQGYCSFVLPSDFRASLLWMLSSLFYSFADKNLIM